MIKDPNKPYSKIKQRKKLLLLIFLVVAIGFLLACESQTRQFLFGMNSPNEMISKKWVIARAVLDGNDVTIDYDQFDLAFTAEGRVEIASKLRIPGQQQTSHSIGQWFFLNNQKKLFLDFQNNDADVVYSILKFKDNEISLKKDDEPLELHFISPH